MKKVFLDTNIPLDTLEERRFSDSSKAVVSNGNEGKYTDLNSLRGILNVVPIAVAQLDAALNNKVRDFEDNIQFQCAKAAGCDVIVTNNVKDFVGLNGVDVMTSEDFLLDFFRI